MKPIDRPSMSRVVEMLEENVKDLQMPREPFLSLQEMLEQDHAPSSEIAEPSTANHSGMMGNYIEQSRITEVILD
ncbi:hypothetical protein AAC387_Pa10g0926 [Persea americana]